MMKRITRGIKNFVGAGIEIITSTILLLVSGLLCLLLGAMQMYLDAVIFFLFGLGMYWYIGMIREKKMGGIWYELDDVGGEK